MLFFTVLKTHTNNNKTALGEGPVNENTRLHSFSFGINSLLSASISFAVCTESPLLVISHYSY